MQLKVESGKHRLSVNYSAGTGNLGVLFCGGFNSSQQGQKALALHAFCQQEQIPFVRFDYSGHGESEGLFTHGSIDTWLKDTIAVIDQFNKPDSLIIVGSSMGAWLSVLATLSRPKRIAGLITIAAAPDFTERLMRQRFSTDQIEKINKEGYIDLPSDYDDGSPYRITRALLTDSRQHCVLGSSIDINDRPVRMLHGCEDRDVPHALSIELMGKFNSRDVELILIKDGDHRLSDPTHLRLLERTLKQLFLTLQKRQ